MNGPILMKCLRELGLLGAAFLVGVVATGCMDLGRPDPKVTSNDLQNECDPGAPNGQPVPTEWPFYVWRDSDSPSNHYTLGKVWGNGFPFVTVDSVESPVPGDTGTCLRVTYVRPTPGETSEAFGHWYWADPPGNMGGRQGGYNLSEARTVRFKFMGKRGDEAVLFGAGGLKPSDGTVLKWMDTSPHIAYWYRGFPVNSWRSESLELSGSRCRVIGGFGFLVHADSARTDTMVFYLDDIRYER